MISDTARERGDVAYLQLFSYRYRDGKQMLSVGGLLDEPKRVAELSQRPFMQWAHFNGTSEPREISVPFLTAPEKHRLEQYVTAQPPETEAPFELADDLLDNFERYRRYYPQYFEALI